MELNQLTENIIGAAIEVHRELGPGLLESAYLRCLCYELELRKLKFACEVELPVIYKSIRLDCGYRVDLVVENRVIVELKSIRKLELIHEAQALTHLRLGGWQIGLLINFNVRVLKDGLKRLIQGTFPNDQEG